MRKEHGEKVRRWLIANGLLDSGFRIDSGDQYYLFLPLSGPVVLEKLESDYKPVNAEIVIHPVHPAQKRTSYKDILRKSLPEHLHPLIPSSFDSAGGVTVVKLNPGILAYKEAIGEALISTIGTKAVYLKTGRVSGNFRLPELELIAGTPVKTTVHKEHGIKVVVDVESAFFNPRLGKEHYRVASLVQDSETVIDFFAGVGPFPLMIAKLVSALVYAVDINPVALKCLEESLRINRLKGRIVPLVGDIRHVLNDLPEPGRIIMNLPSSSHEYLELAINKIKPGGIIHYYGFSPKKATNPLESVCQAVKALLKEFNRNGEIINAFVLREVSVARYQVAIDLMSLD